MSMNKKTLQELIQKDIKKDKLYNSLMATGTTLPFRSTSRQYKPVWGNRIVKDFYDLDYTINVDKFNDKKEKKISGLNQFRKTAIMNITKSKQKSSSTQSNKFKNIDKKYLTKNDYTTPQTCRVEVIKMDNNNVYSTADTCGLSQFEYKNTIQGGLKYRANHHLDFEGQPSRKVNEYKVWYNPQLVHNHEYAKNKNERNKRGKFHSFDSYTDRKVFQPRKTIDKFYQIQESWRNASPIRIKNTVSIDKIVGRKQQQDHFSNQLYLKYDIKKGEYKTRKVPSSFSISTTLKKFSIPKEIVKHGRGSFR